MMRHLRTGITFLLVGLLLAPAVWADSLVQDSAAKHVRLPEKPTYVASTVTKIVSAAGTGPFFSICGSSTRTIRVRQILIDYTVATAGLHADPILQKTSTATSSGTSTDLVAVPLDSNYPAATASLVKIYTALGTTGTVVGVVGIQMKWAQITATVNAGGSSSPYPFLYRPYSETDAIVLRGTAQCVQAAFGTTTTNAPTVTASVMWTEE